MTSFARDWRNRDIAHKDLMLKLNLGAKPLESANRLKVKQAIAAICEVVNQVNLHYFNASVHFEPFEQPGGVRELLIHLNRSSIFEEKQQKRIAKREYLPEDFVDDEALLID